MVTPKRILITNLTTIKFERLGLAYNGSLMMLSDAERVVALRDFDSMKGERVIEIIHTDSFVLLRGDTKMGMLKINLEIEASKWMKSLQEEETIGGKFEKCLVTQRGLVLICKE